MWSGLSWLMLVQCVFLVCFEKWLFVQFSWYFSWEKIFRKNVFYDDLFSLTFLIASSSPISPTDPHVADDQQEA